MSLGIKMRVAGAFFRKIGNLFGVWHQERCQLPSGKRDILKSSLTNKKGKSQSKKLLLIFLLYCVKRLYSHDHLEHS